MTKRIIVGLSLDEQARLTRAAGFLMPEGQHDPLRVATAVAESGADEIHLAASLPVTQLIAVISRLHGSISLPITVAAESAGLEELEALRAAGARRVVIGNAALDDPDFIRACATRFESAAVAVGVEVRREDDYWRVVRGSGRHATEWDAVNWARVVEAQGGGELILNCPGFTDDPFALELLGAVSAAVGIPVIGAGETGAAEDIFDAMMIGDADGVLLAAFALGSRTALREIKDYLADRGLAVRRD